MAEHTPSPQAVEAFRAAWHEADAEGDEGNRVSRGLAAALAHHDAELRAEVERLRAEQERHALANDGCVPGAAYRDLAAAHADLRAGIIAAVTALNREFYRRPVTWIERLAKDLRALLAGSGEQPGEAESRTRAGFRYCRECRVRVDDEHGHDRPAPVVPDSTDVRGELLHVLDSHGIDTYIDGTGAEVGVQNLITDILAVVGQGVAEEIERLRDALTDDPDRAALELIVEDAARIARGVGS